MRTPVFIKIPSFLIALVMMLVISSCEETYENTTAIIGKWKLLKADQYEIDDGFIWEFNEDETYTITNTQGKFEDDPFDSNPFRGKGTYTGGYHVDAPKGMIIREKFKAPFFFSAVTIKGNKLEMQFTPAEGGTDDQGLTKYIKLKFESIK